MSKRAFTLIEILVVIAIIGILAGLLLPAVAAVKRFVRKVKARAEVEQMEGAWSVYYQTYQKWPSFATAEATAVPIDGAAATVLMGGNDADNNNRKRMQFMQFQSVTNGTPVNVWAILMPGLPIEQFKYYARFDLDYDNQITGLPDAWPEPVKRNVVIWTINPTVAEGHKDRIIGSWQQ